MSEMDKQRKWKNVNNEERSNNYRRQNTKLKRATDKAKKEYLDRICHSITEFQRTECYDLKHRKTKN